MSWPKECFLSQPLHTVLPAPRLAWLRWHVHHTIYWRVFLGEDPSIVNILMWLMCAKYLLWRQFMINVAALFIAVLGVQRGTYAHNTEKYFLCGSSSPLSLGELLSASLRPRFHIYDFFPFYPFIVYTTMGWKKSWLLRQHKSHMTWNHSPCDWLYEFISGEIST